MGASALELGPDVARSMRDIPPPFLGIFFGMSVRCSVLACGANSGGPGGFRSTRHCLRLIDDANIPSRFNQSGYAFSNPQPVFEQLKDSTWQMKAW
jgi:hypothetical protein